MKTTAFAALAALTLFFAAVPAGAAVSEAVAEQADVFYKRGMDYAGKGDHEKAIREFRDAIRLSPEDARFHFKLGIEYFETMDAEQAIESYRKALSLRPDYGEVEYFLATALADSGREKEAIEHYRKAYEREPKNLDVMFDYGYALYKTKNYADATTVFETFLREVPPGYAERETWTKQMIKEMKQKRFSS